MNTYAYFLVTLDVILILYNVIEDWCKYFGSPEALQNLIVNLILKCECGGAQIVNLLLDCAFLENVNSVDDKMKGSVKFTAKEILENILQEVAYFIRHLRPEGDRCNLLESFVHDVREVQMLLLSPEKLRYQTAARILIFIGTLSI